ncbi:hypothetical protein Scep_010065 [Stephania cephalantha]|uniref:Uncharacterized protein n=1 Tax=Stephania cephalantha TaxID=152367 RepID=A0AAP0JV19_9MAGN
MGPGVVGNYNMGDITEYETRGCWQHIEYNGKSVQMTRNEHINRNEKKTQNSTIRTLRLALILELTVIIRALRRQLVCVMGVCLERHVDAGVNVGKGPCRLLKLGFSHYKLVSIYAVPIGFIDYRLVLLLVTTLLSKILLRTDCLGTDSLATINFITSLSNTLSIILTNIFTILIAIVATILLTIVVTIFLAFIFFAEKDAKKEAFRKYLENSGVLDALTKEGLLIRKSQVLETVAGNGVVDNCPVERVVETVVKFAAMKHFCSLSMITNNESNDDFLLDSLDVIL